MIHVVHHPAYVTEAPARSTYRWGKNGAIRDLLRAKGDAVAWTEPDLIPPVWLEAVHDPDYVAEVLEARVPPDKTRRIGFPITEQVAHRARAVPGGTWTAALLALRHGFAANTAGAAIMPWRPRAQAIACSTIWRWRRCGWSSRASSDVWRSSIATCIRATEPPH